jgi:glycosyltransferase involved in cell wall biosynthesis
MKLKLAILAQAYLFDKTSSINGTLVQLHNLSKGFCKAGIEVHYICQTKDTSKPNYEVIEDIHFHWIQSQKGLFNWRRKMRLYKSILENISPNAVYVRGRNVLQYVAGTYSKSNNIPYVWGTNGEDSAEFWKKLKRLKKSNKSLIKKMALYPLKIFEDWYINEGMKMADEVINQSTHQQEETKRLLGKDGIILSSYFNILHEDVAKSNQVLWLATLSKNKQPEKFIELVKRVDLKTWKAVLGGGSSLKNYQEKVFKMSELANIQCLGSVPFQDSFKFYNESKIYVNTSRPDSDGLPNAYIQSWLSGTIVLSLNHNPNNWMETHNIGYCSNGDLNKLILKVQELIDNPHLLSEMSNNSKLFAKQQFSNDAIIDSYVKLFQNNA